MKKMVNSFLKKLSFLIVLLMISNIGLVRLSAADTRSLVIDFEATDLNGQPFHGLSLSGKPLLLDFWAVWCVPCIEAMPTLNRLSHDLKEEGFEVVGIAVYSGDRTKVRKFLKNHAVDYTVVVGSESVLEKLGVEGFPTYFLVDSKGFLYKSYIGEIEDFYHTVTRDLAEMKEK